MKSMQISGSSGRTPVWTTSRSEPDRHRAAAREPDDQLGRSSTGSPVRTEAPSHRRSGWLARRSSDAIASQVSPWQCVGTEDLSKRGGVLTPQGRAQCRSAALVGWGWTRCWSGGRHGPRLPRAGCAPLSYPDDRLADTEGSARRLYSSGLGSWAAPRGAAIPHIRPPRNVI